MVLQEVLERVLAEVDKHVRESKGYETESWINPLTPVDSVAAFAMARLLTDQQSFDQYVSVAPKATYTSIFSNDASACRSCRCMWIIRRGDARFWTSLTRFAANECSSLRTTSLDLKQAKAARADGTFSGVAMRA